MLVKIYIQKTTETTVLITELTIFPTKETELVKKLFVSMGILANATQSLDRETAELIAIEYDYEIKDKQLPIHVVTKKVEYVDENGVVIKPTEPNAHKFEMLCVDMIEFASSCLPFEVIREKEFAPIKNKTGVDSVESARYLLEQNGYIL